MYNERPEIIISEEEKNVLHLNEMGRKCDNCGYRQVMAKAHIAFGKMS
jgi:hypothetical protein